jgi:hypothetical protein
MAPACRKHVAKFRQWRWAELKAIFAGRGDLLRIVALDRVTHDGTMQPAGALQ